MIVKTCKMCTMYVSKDMSFRIKGVNAHHFLTADNSSKYGHVYHCSANI